MSNMNAIVVGKKCVVRSDSGVLSIGEVKDVSFIGIISVDVSGTIRQFNRRTMCERNVNSDLPCYSIKFVDDFDRFIHKFCDVGVK